MTRFRFDTALREEIVGRLGRFDRRQQEDSGDLKRAAVAVVVAESAPKVA